jgi:hypothetical protein
MAFRRIFFIPDQRYYTEQTGMHGPDPRVVQRRSDWPSKLLQANRSELLRDHADIELAAGSGQPAMRMSAQVQPAAMHIALAPERVLAQHRP